MAWNLPSAWAVGEVSTAAKLNQIRESLDWIHSALDLDSGNPYLVKLAQNNGASYVFTADNIQGTAIDVLPSGAVTRAVAINALVTDTGAVYNLATGAFPKPASSFTDYAMYSTELYLRVHSGGAVQFIRNSGTKIFRVSGVLHVH